MRLSAPPVTIRLLSVEISSEVMMLVCPSPVRSGAPLAGSQRRSILSLPTEATYLPSGLHRAAVTGALWPLHVARGWPPPVISQTLAVLSPLAVPTFVLSGVNAAAQLG